jgi:hypothetical protein
MMLTVRMVLYFFFGALSSQGLDIFDPATGLISIHVEELATVISGLLGFIATFAASRLAKQKGGLT